MNRKSQLNLAVHILTESSKTINLHHNILIKNDDDFNDIEMFFDCYSKKYNYSICDFSKNQFQIKKQYSIISELTQLILNLKPFEFEKFSSFIASILNYTDFYATKPTKDEGVDFIAQRVDNDSLNSIEILFGQCKKFEQTLVSVNEIRELAGAITLFKNGEFMNDKSYISIAQKIKSHSTLKVLFVTSYFFSDEALKLCDNSGIVHIDIIDLIYIIIIGLKNNKVKWTDTTLSHFNKITFYNDINNVQIIH